MPVKYRPPAVEGYLPISSLMSLVYWFKTGIANPVHPAGLIIFSLTIVLAAAVRRGFCSWVCPIGAGAEYLHKTGKKLFGRNFKPYKWLDLILRSLKYLLLGFFVFYIVMMSSEQLRQFIYGPYNRIADVKMYMFMRHMSVTAAVVMSVLFVGSLLIKNFWCRYLCPYGALLGIFSIFSPAAVRRDELKCVNCGNCASACPNRIQVDRKTKVNSTNCTACFSCIDACKKEGAIRFGAGKLRFSVLTYAVVTLAAFVFITQAAKSLGYWHSNTPPQMYKALYRSMEGIKHPRVSIGSAELETNK